MLYYVRDKYVRQYDINTGADVGVLSVRKFGSPYIPPKTLSFNPAERAVVITISSDNGMYELAHLAKDGNSEVRDSATDGKRGSGQSAIFVARNRFAVLNKTSQVNLIIYPYRLQTTEFILHFLQLIEIRDLSNSIVKSVKPPVQTNEIFYGGTASLILSSTNSAVLYDIQQGKKIAEVTTPPVKYIVWSNDGTLVALLSKHSEFHDTNVHLNVLKLCNSNHDCEQELQPE